MVNQVFSYIENGFLSFILLYLLGTFVQLTNAPERERLRATGHHPQDYWSRRQKYAINVQMIGDAFGRIRHVVATWPGSTHDSRVWRTSSALTAIETQNEFSIAGYNYNLF